MNAYKPLAFVLAAGLAVSIGVQASAASGGASRPDHVSVWNTCQNQPNMAAALADLQTSLSALRIAEHNKDGWRDAAIAATETALARTVTGCAMAH